MIGHALPVFQGYSSQYGHGLGNVLGGVFRAAVPLLGKFAKKAGTQLLDTGINYLQDKVLKKRKAPQHTPKLPAKRRKVIIKKKKTGSRSVAHKRRPPGKTLVSRRKGDIFDIRK